MVIHSAASPKGPEFNSRSPEHVLPRIPYNCLKPFWFDELDGLKGQGYQYRHAQTLDSVRKT